MHEVQEFGRLRDAHKGDFLETLPLICLQAKYRAMGLKVKEVGGEKPVLQFPGSSPL